MRTVMYYCEWAVYARAYPVSSLPVDKLTHVNYAFAKVDPATGRVDVADRYAAMGWDEGNGEKLHGSMAEIFQLKNRARHVKVLLSVGGATETATSAFAAVASSPVRQQAFVQSCMTLLTNLPFDGLDLDWEFPTTAAEGAAYARLLAALRSAMGSVGLAFGYLLTVAAPCGRDNYSHLPLAEMDRSLDYWNLMAYDFSGAWTATADHQANIYGGRFSADAAVKAYLAAGIAPDKLVLGMPLYGRSFKGTDGPCCAFSGVGDGSWEAGVYDYKQLPPPGATEYVDRQHICTWSYDPSLRVLVSYDSPESAVLKADYIRARGLGGAMFWEASADHPPSHPRSLVAAVHARLQPAGLDRSLNCVCYPRSRYFNIHGV
ncbi:glycoside hydrolase [Dipodascopsis tothii]|uniref:glycoside hydrolase n=1 Tax=Dipodascopsis tothii TaxID=44089 RepID=UPI0034D01864